MHRLRFMGDAVLRQAARTLDPGEAATTGTLQLAMWAALRAENGRGIAAPQLGSALQMFLLAPKHNSAKSSSPTATEALLVMNPRVTRRSHLSALEWETCSSVPGPAATSCSHTSCWIVPHVRSPAPSEPVW
jgi:peptide deformylase